MKTYAAYFGTEECIAYGRFEVESLEEATEEAVESMQKNVDPAEAGHWEFRPDPEKPGRIEMYFDGDYQDWVDVHEVPDDEM